MRILYICYEDLQQDRGSTRHVVEVVRHLGKLGHTVDLFVPAPVPRSPFGLSTGIRVHPIGTVDVRIVRWLVFYVLSGFSAVAVGRRVRPDAVYVREMSYNLVLAIVAGFLGCPLVVEVNSFLLDEMRMVGKGRVELWLTRLCQRIMLRTASRVVAVSQGLADRLVREYGLDSSRLSVIQNGTDAEHFRPQDCHSARQAVGLPTARPLVGFVGGCYPYHDVPTLINAAPLVIDRCPGALFVIVGDGHMRDAWRRQVVDAGLYDSFVFTGATPYAEVPFYLNSFTVCVAPFTWGGNTGIGLSPLKLFEYMACGRPVVASDIPGMGDLLRENKAGIAVPPESSASLALAIVNLLENPVLCDEMGRRGREAIVASYTWERVARQIVAACGLPPMGHPL